MTTPVLAESVKGKGRHYRHPATDDLLPSVTNVIGILDKHLQYWAAREVAAAAVTMKASLGGMSDEEVMDVLKGAPFRRSSRAAGRGTDIHQYLEQAMLFQPLPELAGDALNYQAAADRWLTEVKPTTLFTEVTLFHAGYAGTADAIIDVEGETWLIDFKTSKGIYDEVALQLGALWACPQLYHAGALADAPSIDRVAAVRIGRDGEWEMKEVVDPAGSAAAFLSLLEAWKWKNGDEKPLMPVELVTEDA
jgi:hypothetical protein